MNARVFKGRSLGRIVAAVLCLEAVCASALWYQARQIRSENLVLQTSIADRRESAGPSEELQLLSRENEQLKKAIESIPALEAQAQLLERERSERAALAETMWARKADAIDLAIEGKKRELRETQEWFTEFERAKAQEKAAARLAQKAAEGKRTSAETAKEYAELQKNLGEAALRMKALTELRSTFQKMEKTPEERAWFKEKMNSTWLDLDKAMKRLGSDVDLYQELPISNTQEDYSKIPFLRSVLPDLQGRSVTVYLDGTVQWSPQAPQMSAR